MKKLWVVLAALFALALVSGGAALGAGPSGSTECHVQDDDCDGAFDEDPVGDANNDGNPDDDFDGRVDEDPPGDAADDPGENQVDCNEQTSQNVGGVAFVYAGSNGAELCADDGSQVPLDGRFIVTNEQGGYVAADGDNSNPPPANGYLRLDQGGAHCGDEFNQDSTANQSTNTSQDCG